MIIHGLTVRHTTLEFPKVLVGGKQAETDEVLTANALQIEFAAALIDDIVQVELEVSF